jgi:hypothetical protein
MRNAVWQFVYDWQTLGAGLLALVAGLGTIAATRSAARDQISVAQDPIDLSQKSELRRVAREGYAFAETLRASMATVREDVKEARKMVSNLQGDDDVGTSPQAYDARRRIHRTGFAELRAAFIRLGGELTEPFLRIDGMINYLEAQAYTQSGNDILRKGKHYRLNQELDRISELAASLGQQAEREKERWGKMLETE